MKRIQLEGFNTQERAVVTVGSFDGLHIGHRAVIDRVKSLSAEREGTSVIVTFDPHPRQVISPDSAPKLLTSLEEKSAIFGRMGVDLLAVVSFTHDLRQLGPEAFVDRYLIDYLKAEMIVLGYDHGFGRDRSGDLETMQALAAGRGFVVESVPPALLEGDPVSSTRVRGHLELGEMEEAKRLLGEGYPISGVVEEGDGRGQTIGFPTANLNLASTKQLPPDGVYAGLIVSDDGSVDSRAVINLGTRPTFEENNRRFEAHILDFQGDLYGKHLTVALETRLRDEHKFENLESLKSQINEDIAEARRRLDGAGIQREYPNRSRDGG